MASLAATLDEATAALAAFTPAMRAMMVESSIFAQAISANAAIINAQMASIQASAQSAMNAITAARQAGGAGLAGQQTTLQAILAQIATIQQLAATSSSPSTSTFLPSQALIDQINSVLSGKGDPNQLIMMFQQYESAAHTAPSQSGSSSMYFTLLLQLMSTYFAQLKTSQTNTSGINYNTPTQVMSAFEALNDQMELNTLGQ